MLKILSMELITLYVIHITGVSLKDTPIPHITPIFHVLSSVFLALMFTTSYYTPRRVPKYIFDAFVLVGNYIIIFMFQLRIFFPQKVNQYIMREFRNTKTSPLVN